MEDEPNKKSPRSEPFTRPMFVFEVEQPSSSRDATASVASPPPLDSLQRCRHESLVKTAHMFGGLSAAPNRSLDAERDVRGGYAAASPAGVRVVPTAFVGVSSTRNNRRAVPSRELLSEATSATLEELSLSACQIIEAPHARGSRSEPDGAARGSHHPNPRPAPLQSRSFEPNGADAAILALPLSLPKRAHDEGDLCVTPLRPYPADLSVTPLRPYPTEPDGAVAHSDEALPSAAPEGPHHSELGFTPVRAHAPEPDIAPPRAQVPAPGIAVAYEAAPETRAERVEQARTRADEPARAAGALKLSARSPLFRREALLAYRRGERAASVLQVTSVSRWALLLSLACALALALALVSFGQVEERSLARGVLRVPFGLQPVVPLISGTVREVLVTPGARVEAGQLLVRLDATPLAAELGEAEQRLSALEAQWRRQSESLKSNFERGLALTNARIGLLAQRRRNQARRIARRHSQAERIEAPELADVVERTVREQTADALDGAKDELLQLSDGVSELRLQQSASRSEYEQQLAAGEQRLRDARARRDAARLLLQQSELHAPIAGKVESLRVHAGQTVQAGEWVARVVRAEAPTTIVAFVPERDAAFLRTGAPANVEVDKLPMGEFGFAHARVQRVVGELAEASELTAALGETAPQGPHIRVELALEESPETARVRPFLRAGTLVSARIALRDRRLLAIVFEPARRWLR